MDDSSLRLIRDNFVGEEESFRSTKNGDSSSLSYFRIQYYIFSFIDWPLVKTRYFTLNQSIKMEHEEMGCQTPPEAPVLCVNNCGFFGVAANMNMCSKCYKDAMLKQEQAKLAASSIDNIVNGSSSSNKKEPTVVQTEATDTEAVQVPSINSPSPVEPAETKTKGGPNRCSSCKKRVGLTGFRCRCGDLFCGSHRYSDKHNCPFDYRSAGQEAIAKANPVVKAEKLNKI